MDHRRRDFPRHLDAEHVRASGPVISNTSTEGRIYELSSGIMFATRSCWTTHPTGKFMRCRPKRKGAKADSPCRSTYAIEQHHLREPAHVPGCKQLSAVPLRCENHKLEYIRFRNFHCYSDSKVSFDNALYDQTDNIEVHQREFAWLTILASAPKVQPKQPSSVLAEGAKVEKLAGGLFNISGGAVDSSGNVYFVDAKWQTIYRWNTVTRELSKVRDNPLDPVQLFFDKVGDLIVVSYAGKGTVYSFKPGFEGDGITLLPAVPAQPRPGMTPILPAGYWRNEKDFLEKIAAKPPYQFVSPDGRLSCPQEKTSSPASCTTERS